jgi:hypothetical protein
MPVFWPNLEAAVMNAVAGLFGYSGEVAKPYQPRTKRTTTRTIVRTAIHARVETHFQREIGGRIASSRWGGFPSFGLGRAVGTDEL